MLTLKQCIRGQAWFPASFLPWKSLKIASPGNTKISVHSPPPGMESFPLLETVSFPKALLPLRENSGTHACLFAASSHRWALPWEAEKSSSLACPQDSPSETSGSSLPFSNLHQTFPSTCGIRYGAQSLIYLSWSPVTSQFAFVL